ncbi:MAG: hypothetical protein GWN71_10865, partial [Gammaproteobacteria bacterium]|nr:hypothetical protein [Gemmatimonadota bacterium]NIU74059.1 hypothetical protein [Gammaproteobacteria bacterium]
LSTDLDAVSANLERDGVGRALPIKELSVEMLRWATRPVLWREYRDRAEALAPEVRSGEAMRGWIEELG